MQINLKAPIVTYNGKCLQDKVDGKDIDATLKRVIELACVNANVQKYTTAEQKLKIYKILKWSNEEGAHILDLPVEDVALIKELVNDNFPPHVVGAIYEAIEAKPKVVREPLQEIALPMPSGG